MIKLGTLSQNFIIMDLYISYCNGIFKLLSTIDTWMDGNGTINYIFMLVSKALETLFPWYNECMSPKIIFIYTPLKLKTHKQICLKLSLLHIVPFCEGPNKKSEGFAKEKQKTWRACEGKKICQICDPKRIATCGAPLITNLEWTFNHRKTFARYTTNKTLRFVQSLSIVAIFHPSQRLIILKTSQPLQDTEYRYRLWDPQHIATCGMWRLAVCISICIANLITNFYKTFRWWTYRKVRCELARKLMKGLLEKEVLQKGFAMSYDSQNAIKK